METCALVFVLRNYIYYNEQTEQRSNEMKTKMFVGGFLVLSGVLGVVTHRLYTIKSEQDRKAERARKRYFTAINDLQFALSMELIDNPDEFRSGMERIFDELYLEQFDLKVKRF